MGKEEDLFDNIDLDSQFDNTVEENGIDVSEFMSESEENNDNEDNNADLNEDSDESKNVTNANEEDANDTDDTIDSEEFEKTENNSVNDDSSANNSSSPLQLLATTLQAEGVIDLEEGEEIETSEQILNAVRSKIEKNEYSDLTDNQKTYLEALRSGIPEEEVKQNLNNIKALEGITNENIESNEALRKELIVQDFIAKGISPQKATKLADSSIQLGDDLEDAKEAYNSLKTIESNRIRSKTEELKKQEEEKVQKDKEYLQSLKTRILEQEEIIPGFKTNSSTREKVYETMTKVAGRDENGNPLNALNVARQKNPEKIELIETYLFNLTKGFEDWSPLKGKLKTNAVKELDKKLKGSQSKGGIPTSTKSVSEQNGGGLAEAFRNLKI